MSDIEQDNDQLFGDEDSEQEQQQDQEQEQEQDQDQDQEDVDDIFGDDDEDDVIDSEQSQFKIGQDVNESAGQRLIEVTVPRYPTSHKSNSPPYLSRIPPFLKFEAHPFDSERFLDDVTAEAENATPEEISQLKLQRENTIRWKYSRDSKGGVVKESNARFIKWDDGSVSLQLGNEMFDVHEKAHQDTFLTVSQPKNQLLQTTDVLAKTMTFVPTSTSSQIHRQITEQLAKKQLKGSNVVGNFATTIDPETIKREAEKAEDAKIKQRRKMEAKRRQLEEREGGFGRASPAGGSRGGGNNDDPGMGYAYGGGLDEYEDEDEDDQFVVSDGDEEEGQDDDDDDDDKKAERLRGVKDRGSRMYEDSEEEGELSELEENEDQQEDASNVKKKRKIVDDEDDDE